MYLKKNATLCSIVLELNFDTYKKKLKMKLDIKGRNITKSKHVESNFLDYRRQKIKFQCTEPKENKTTTY